VAEETVVRTFCYRCVCGRTKELRKNSIPHRPACDCGRVMRRDFRAEAVTIHPNALPTRRTKS